MGRVEAAPVQAQSEAGAKRMSPGRIPQADDAERAEGVPVQDGSQ